MLHGGDPNSYAKARGLKEREVLDFSVNLNPLGPPKVVKEMWQDLIGYVSGYPSITGVGIQRYYEQKFGIPRDMVVGGNGSTELIYMIPRVLRPNSTLIFEPSYSDYKRACYLAGVRVMTYGLDPITNFDYPGVSTLEGLLARVDSVWFGRPNNPTGKSISKTELNYLAKRYPEKLFILDESFIQFMESWYPETFILPNLPQNIVVIHSLTKFYSLPGIRMGAAIAHRYICETLQRYKEPWTVNMIADKLAPALANQLDYEEDTRRLIKEERERITYNIGQKTCWEVFDSKANFLLLRWKGKKTLDELLENLYENGIYVRDARNFVGLEENYIRVGIKSSNANDLLLEKLEILSGEEYGWRLAVSGLCP